MRKLIKSTAVLAASVLVLASCSSGSDNSGSTSVASSSTVASSPGASQSSSQPSSQPTPDSGTESSVAPTEAASSEGSAEPTKSDASGVKIVMLLNDQFDPYYLTLVKGAQEEADARGIDFSWQAPSTLDIASQTQLLQSIAATKPDGIIMSALDADALVAPMKEIQAAGVPIVTVDADVNDPSARLTTFKSNGIEAGELAAETMNELLGGKGKVGYVGYTPGIQSVDIRLKGWTEKLKEYSGLENVGDQYGTADIADNVTKASALIARTPDLGGIFASWTNASIGAAQAVQQAGKTGQIKVIGMDASPDEVDMLRRGLIDGLVVQKPYDMGKDAVDVLIAHVLDGVDPSGDKLYDFVMATPDNIDDPEISKYLYVKPEGK